MNLKVEERVVLNKEIEILRTKNKNLKEKLQNLQKHSLEQQNKSNEYLYLQTSISNSYLDETN